ncbi:Heterokaryon incompatibility protein (HET) domain containing protein [Hyaloscypha variabilis]
MDEMGEFGIRVNLFNFISTTVYKHYLTDQPLPLYWINQICIDQSNISERNAQVKLMHAIYSRAELVAIWLREPAQDSDIAMRFLGGRRMAALSWVSQEGRRQTAVHALSRRLISPRCLDALQALSNRPYWQRIWILQEVAFAGRCVVYCGDQSITWEQVIRFLRLSSIKSKDKEDHFSIDLSPMGRVASIATFNNAASPLWPQSLADLLIMSDPSKSTDPRDRVFALLALASPNSKGEVLEADYSKTTLEVFEAVLRHLMSDALCMGAGMVTWALDKALGIRIGSGIEELREESLSHPRPAHPLIAPLVALDFAALARKEPPGKLRTALREWSPF